MRKYHKNLGFVWIIFAFIIFLSGCTKGSASTKERENTTNRLWTSLPKVPQNISEYKVDYSYRKPETVIEPVQDTKKAKQMASMIAALPEIEKATVLLTGNTALVGIHISQTLSNDQLDALKEKIQNQIQKEQPHIRHVSVTHSPELVGRMTVIAEDIMEGRPIQGLADEIGVILRRATPTL